MSALKTAALQVTEFTRHIGLQARVATLLAIAILPVGMVGIWQAVGTATEASRLEQEELVARTREAAEEEKLLLATADGVLEGIGSLFATRDLSRQTCDEALTQLTETGPRFAIAAILLRDRTVACASRPVIDDMLESLVAGWEPLFTSDHEILLSSGQPALDQTLINVSRPLFQDGEHIATVVVGVPTSLLTILARSDDHAGFRMAIVDWRGERIAESAPGGSIEWWPEELVFSGETFESEQIVTDTASTGEKRAYAVVPVVPGELFAIGSWQVDSLILSAQSRTWKAVFYPAVVWIIALVVSHIAVHRLVVRHISYLRRVMSAFADGRRTVRASALSTAAPEISELGRSFDQMASKIELNEEELEHSVEEKNILLLEVHHRVKNNLQLVISMMNMQMRDAPSDQAREAIQRISSRVMGLATVHQRLYQAGDLTAVDCSELIEEIARQLITSDPRAGQVQLKSDLQPLNLDPDRAIPLALITTESVINALKYSADQRPIEIRLAMTEHDGQMEVTIENPVDDIETAGTGAGTQLVAAFARQLGGEIGHTVADGLYQVSLSFPREMVRATPTS